MNDPDAIAAMLDLILSALSRPRAGDVLRVEDAAAALPIRVADARAWLRERRLVRDLAGRDVVVWDEVIACIAGPNLDSPETGGSQTPSQPRRIVAGVDLDEEEARWRARSGRRRSK